MFEDFLNWLHEPFKPSMSAGYWFLFIGFIIVSLYLWHMVTRDLHGVASEALAE